MKTCYGLEQGMSVLPSSRWDLHLHIRAFTRILSTFIPSDLPHSQHKVELASAELVKRTSVVPVHIWWNIPR